MYLRRSDGAPRPARWAKGDVRAAFPPTCSGLPQVFTCPDRREGPVYYRRMRARVSILMLLPFASLACAAGPENPSFPLRETEARTALRQMEDRPKPLQRPVLVIGGYLDFGVTPSLVRSELRAVTADDR